MKTYIIYIFILMCTCIISCNSENKTIIPQQKEITTPSIIILGTVQDAGSPHIGCTKDCCKDLYNNPDKNRMVVSLGLLDPAHKMNWLFEATPDITRQLKNLKEISHSENEMPNGIFLTHAHIGHYAGLMYLGKEAISAKKVPVYAMPRMKTFLIENGPWSQLVKLENIDIKALQNDSEIRLSSNIKVTPIKVPHRDEFSETVGYMIHGPHKKALFIPDIDKWSKWEKSIIAQIKNVDYAFVDATFYDGNEIKSRDISEIPHPFVIESMEAFKDLPKTEKDKIYFIHFNHTNPLLNIESEQAKTVIKNGFHVAQVNTIIAL